MTHADMLQTARAMTQRQHCARQDNRLSRLSSTSCIASPSTKKNGLGASRDRSNGVTVVGRFLYQPNCARTSRSS